MANPDTFAAIAARPEGKSDANDTCIVYYRYRELCVMTLCQPLDIKTTTITSEVCGTNVMTIRDVRIPPLPIHEWADTQKQVLMAFVEAVPDDFQGGHKEETDYTALEVLLNHPALAKAYLSYSQWLMQKNELPTRDKELAILRVGVMTKSTYEWAQHIMVARHERIPDDDIRRVITGPDAPEWNEKERCLLRAVDELVGGAFISDQTWESLAGYYSTNQLLEIMFTVGSYTMMAMVFNSVCIPMNEHLQAAAAEFPL